jgi:predicted nucleic acid-binding protein
MPSISVRNVPEEVHRAIRVRAAQHGRSIEARVIEWLDAQPLETLYLPAMAVAELRAGVALLPAGKRRTALHENLEERVLTMFVGRVLPFDLACTNAYAELLARARKAGNGIETAGACIAAIAIANGFIFATRDTSPFHAAGLNVINPWEDA